MNISSTALNTARISQNTTPLTYKKRISSDGITSVSRKSSEVAKGHLFNIVMARGNSNPIIVDNDDEMQSETPEVLSWVVKE